MVGLVQRLGRGAVWPVQTVGDGRDEGLEAPAASDALVTAEHEDLQTVNLNRLLIEVNQFLRLWFSGENSGTGLDTLADWLWLPSLCLWWHFKLLWLFNCHLWWLRQFLRSEIIKTLLSHSTVITNLISYLKISILSILVGLRSGIGARRRFFGGSFGFGFWYFWYFELTNFAGYFGPNGFFSSPVGFFVKTPLMATGFLLKGSLLYLQSIGLDIFLNNIPECYLGSGCSCLLWPMVGLDHGHREILGREMPTPPLSFPL